MKPAAGYTSYRFIISIGLLMVLHTACKPYSGKKENKLRAENSVAPAKVYKKPPSGLKDTLIINTPAAVFFTADSMQLGKIRIITDKMFYESAVHDCYYQMRNARMVLKQNRPFVKITETNRHRYLLFIYQDHTRTCLDLDSLNDMCGIYLFHPGKKPQLSDMMNIDTEIGFYFDK